MKIILLIWFIFVVSFAFAETEVDLSSRIIIDGYSEDFSADENVLKDTLGNLLESPTDSYWGADNEIFQLKTTWDANYLYLAVDGLCYSGQEWLNCLMLMIDIYDDYGIEDMTALSDTSGAGTWQRAIEFYGPEDSTFNPDFFWGTWDTNIDPQFWKVTENSDSEITQYLDVPDVLEDYASINSLHRNRSMEVKVSWDSLYYSDDRNMAIFPEIRLVAFISGGSDFTSGPDAAPDNLGGMTGDAGQTVVLDNYVELMVDEDGDGNADIGVFPNKRVSFRKRPPFKALPLEILKIKFNTPRTFCTSYGEKVSFVLDSNRQSHFNCEIYDVEGKYIDHADLIGEQEWEWDGRNHKGVFVPFGIYLLRFVSDSGEVHHKEAVAVIK
jgi:hypothetical protein